MGIESFGKESQESEEVMQARKTVENIATAAAAYIEDNGEKEPDIEINKAIAPHAERLMNAAEVLRGNGIDPASVTPAFEQIENLIKERKLIETKEN